jgi:DUF177 domain-containing protein
MLSVQIGALDRGPVEVSGMVASDDPLFDDVGFELRESVRVSGRLSGAGVGRFYRFYWKGRIATTVRATCRRCLASTALEIDVRVDVVFTENQDAEDPSEYVVPKGAGLIDLGEAIREELILATRQFVLCREDCKGLCQTCGTDLNLHSCDCRPSLDSRWTAFEPMKTKSGEQDYNGSSQEKNF